MSSNVNTTDHTPAFVGYNNLKDERTYVIGKNTQIGRVLVETPINNLAVKIHSSETEPETPTVEIFSDSTSQKIILRYGGGGGYEIHLNLADVQAPPAVSCSGGEPNKLKIREIDVCCNGVKKKMKILASDTY